MQRIKGIKIEYIILLLLLIPAVWALFVPGYYGASDDLHIAWLQQMDRTSSLGQFPPRYVPDLSYQFGYPLFNFVFPLPFYIGEVIHLIGFSFVASIKAVFLLSVVFSAFAMFALLRNFAGRWLSLVGALLYVYTPFRSTDIYVRGALGEAVAFVFFPLITLSILKLSQKGKTNWVGLGALFIAGLILTHNIAAYMFIPVSVLLSLMLIYTIDDRQLYLKRILSMYILGFLASIYFWLPAILDSSLMKYDTVFNYIDHFPTIRQLITPYFGYGASVPGPGDGMSFFIGALNLLLIPALLFVLYKARNNFKSKSNITLLWSLIVFGIVFVFMNHRSVFLWETMPFVKYFQFPWRFLMLTTFTTSFFIICLEKLKPNLLIKIGLVVFIILANFTYFRPQDFLGREDDYYLNRYIPVPDASEEYRKTSEEYLRLPKNTLERPAGVQPDIFGDNIRVIESDNSNPFNSEYAIEVSGKDSLVNISRYNFPGWQVFVNGQLENINSGRPYGQISFEVSEGVHSIVLQFNETKRNYLLNMISLTSIFFALFFALNKKWKK